VFFLNNRKTSPYIPRNKRHSAFNRKISAYFFNQLWLRLIGQKEMKVSRKTWVNNNPKRFFALNQVLKRLFKNHAKPNAICDAI
jgi:hypothetical protein